MEDTLMTLLENNIGVGSRIYATYAGDSPTLPYVVYNTLDGRGIISHDGPSDMSDYYISFNIYTDNIDDGIDIKDDIIDLLPDVYESHFRTLYEQNTRIFHVVLDVKMMAT